VAELVVAAFITATLLMRAFMEERQVAMLLLLVVLVALALEHHMVQVLALVAVE
jgi:hypothetical protein